MHSDDENISHTSTFSELHSISDKFHPKDLQRQNDRLRKEKAKLTEMNVQLSDECRRTRQQSKKKDEQIEKIQFFYKTEIASLKGKIYQEKRKETKRTIFSSKTGEQNCIQNANCAEEAQINEDFKKKKGQITKGSHLERFLSKQAQKQGQSICQRSFELKQRLQKLGLDEAVQKCNTMICELKQKRESEQDQQINCLKNKINCIRDTPLSINLYSQRDLTEFETILSSLDVQIGLLNHCGPHISEFS